ncbi:AAA family ATPase, partial [Acinetobacter baumannii]|uniref:AAA family ATPase n=1 Tax=Acinetobacter baumannii TaxID=470 RepID=UPI001CB7E79D
GYLLIDEVENGIHHSKQLNFIRHICNLAFKRNIQIFMTTHSAHLPSEILHATWQANMSVVLLGIFPSAMAYVLWGYVLKNMP